MTIRPAFSAYAIGGAAFGYATLWTALLSFPLMVAVQMMCGRLGMVSGRRLAAVIRLHYPRWILWGACSLLLTPNVINIAADLAGMGEAAAMVSGRERETLDLFLCRRYRQLSFLVFVSSDCGHLQWMTLVLLAYMSRRPFLRMSIGGRLGSRRLAATVLVPRLSLSSGWHSCLAAAMVGGASH
jgi:hypothetical protein